MAYSPQTDATKCPQCKLVAERKLRNCSVHSLDRSTQAPSSVSDDMQFVNNTTQALVNTVLRNTLEESFSSPAPDPTPSSPDFGGVDFGGGGASSDW